MRDQATINNTLTSHELQFIIHAVKENTKVIDLKWHELYLIGMILKESLEFDKFIPDMNIPAFAINVIADRVKEKNLQLF